MAITAIRCEQCNTWNEVEWTSVRDAPVPNHDVLVTDGKSVYIAHSEDMHLLPKITHWQVLPLPPRAK